MLTQKIQVSYNLDSRCVPSFRTDARDIFYSSLFFFHKNQEGVPNKIICNKLTVYSFPMYIHVFKINPRSLSHAMFFLSLWTLQIIYQLFKLSYYLTVISGSKGDRHSMDTMDPTAETRHQNKNKFVICFFLIGVFQNKLKYKWYNKDSVRSSFRYRLLALTPSTVIKVGLM